MGRPLTLGENRALWVSWVSEACRRQLATWLTTAEHQATARALGLSSVERPSHSKNDRNSTCGVCNNSNTLTFQRMACLWIHSTHNCKSTHVRVPLPLTRIFHFITSLVCDDRDKTAVTEMSEGGRKKGVWNWTGNYVLQLRHAEEILKAILQCLGTECRKGGSNGRRQFNQNPLVFLTEGGGKGGKRDRMAMFNNVRGISVVERTKVCKIHHVIELQNEPNAFWGGNGALDETLNLKSADTPANICLQYSSPQWSIWVGLCDNKFNKRKASPPSQWKKPSHCTLTWTEYVPGDSANHESAMI